MTLTRCVLNAPRTTSGWRHGRPMKTCMQYLPLRPRWDHLLHVGLSKPRGQKASKVIDRTGELPEWVERGYQHQSTKQYVEP